jgi:nucleoside-diphosphate-sugar epimerase
MNTVAPAHVCERFRDSRIAAFSTGNVYGMTTVDGGGSRETDAPAPDGEYAMSALGRERVFEYYSRACGIPTSLVRLNYACELRYGVLVDIANWVWHGEPVPLATGYLNAIWQRDANALTLRAFDYAATPPFVTNVAGPETLRVRDIANEFGARFDKPVQFQGNGIRDRVSEQHRRHEETVRRRTYARIGHARLDRGVG